MKPNICEILGVEIGEEFEFNGDRYKIEKVLDEFDKCVGYDFEKYYDCFGNWECGETLDLIDILNDLDKINHKRWTVKDVEDAKKVDGWFPNVYFVERSMDGNMVYLKDHNGNKLCKIYSVAFARPMFPSVKPRDTVMINSILLGAE